MQIDLKTIDIKPLRQTFDHLAERFGDKPASRYQEGTYDIQQSYLYHYKPTWEPDREIFDEKRTAIRMTDWYAFKDPRQYYYYTYTCARAKQQEAADSAMEFADENGLARALPEGVSTVIRNFVIPMRHAEWGANLNNTYISAYCFGTAIDAAANFAAMDRLGIAQHLSRIGLMVGNSALLDDAKLRWLEAPDLQPLRRYVEDSFVIKDWFELLVAQNLVSDGLLLELVYARFEQNLSGRDGNFFGIVTKFIRDWTSEHQRWVDSVIKIAASESDGNRELLTGWIGKYAESMVDALRPIAAGMLGDDASAVLAETTRGFTARVQKLGIVIEGKL